MSEARILCQDSKDLSAVDAASVHLTVTSPPYRNAIDYKKHLEGGWHRGTTTWTTSDWRAAMRMHFAGVFERTVEGGYLAIIVGNERDHGNLVPLPAYLSIDLATIGWAFCEEWTWDKVTGGAARFGVTVQHPYPTYYFPNDMHERILLFRRGAKVRRKGEKLVIDSVMKREIANSVWHIPPVPPRFLPHPCPFPEEIPMRLIQLYTYSGDVVLDPFNGIGQTTKVAHQLGRVAIGYDIEEQYCAVARKRLEEPLHLRTPIVAKYEKVPHAPLAEKVLGHHILPTGGA